MVSIIGACFVWRTLRQEAYALAGWGTEYLLLFSDSNETLWNWMFFNVHEYYPPTFQGTSLPCTGVLSYKWSSFHCVVVKNSCTWVWYLVGRHWLRQIIIILHWKTNLTDSLFLLYWSLLKLTHPPLWFGLGCSPLYLKNLMSCVDFEVAMGLYNHWKTNLIFYKMTCLWGIKHILWELGESKFAESMCPWVPNCFEKSLLLFAWYEALWNQDTSEFE